MEKTDAARRTTRLLHWLLAAVVLMIALGHLRSWYRQMPVDLGAFYSAGRVVLQHEDPYLTEPLLSVEREVAGPTIALTSVIPVPLPAYDLVVLSYLARLSPHVATLFFCLLTVAALAIIAYVLSVMSPLSLPLAFAAAFYGTAYIASTIGQLSPLAIAAIALGALFVRRDKPTMASVCVGCAMLQPQFAAPVVIICLLLVPRMRASLIAMIALLGALSVPLGTARIAEYLKVLPLHARAELVYPAQYSLSWVLSRAGFGDNLALGLGTLCNLGTLVVALSVLAMYRRAAITSGAVVLLPAALAVFGGTFVHEYQMEVALLAALILARKSQWGLDASFAAGLLLIPFFLIASTEAHWPHLSTLPSIIFSFVTAWAITFDLADSRSRRERLRIASTQTCLFLALFVALALTRPPLDRLTHVQPVAPQSLRFASDSWRLTVRAKAEGVNGLAWIIFIKLPTWFAVLFAVTSAVRTLAAADGKIVTAGSPDRLARESEQSMGVAPM